MGFQRSVSRRSSRKRCAGCATQAAASTCSLGAPKFSGRKRSGKTLRRHFSRTVCLSVRSAPFPDDQVWAIMERDGLCGTQAHRRWQRSIWQNHRTGESAGIITAALPRFFVCDIHSSVLPGHPSFSPGAATAIKLSTTSSKCLYCSGVSRATFRTRIDVSSSEILPSNR